MHKVSSQHIKPFQPHVLNAMLEHLNETYPNGFNIFAIEQDVILYEDVENCVFHARGFDMETGRVLFSLRQLTYEYDADDRESTLASALNLFNEINQDEYVAPDMVPGTVIGQEEITFYPLTHFGGSESTTRMCNIIRCACGGQVTIAHTVNACDSCDREYSSSGNQLLDVDDIW